MARITGYGQSARIEWDRPVEFYFRKGESLETYMDRILADASVKEVELTERFLKRHIYAYLQTSPNSTRKSTLAKNVVRYLANRTKGFDMAAFAAPSTQNRSCSNSSKGIANDSYSIHYSRNRYSARSRNRRRTRDSVV